MRQYEFDSPDVSAIVDNIQNEANSLSRPVRMQLLSFLCLIVQRKTPRNQRLAFRALRLAFKLIIDRLDAKNSLQAELSESDGNERSSVPCPSISQVKFLFRLLRQFPSNDDCELLIDAMKQLDFVEALHHAHAIVKRRRHRREQQAIDSPKFRKTVSQFLGYVNYPSGSPYVDFAGGSTEESITAYTDGKRIFLPQTIALDGGAYGHRTNLRALVFLSLHELQHWGILNSRSSFAFSFDTDLGNQLLDKLRDRRDVFERNLADWDGKPVFKQMLREAGLDEDLVPPKLSHLQAFTFFGNSPERLSMFYNLFEDMRLAHQLADSQFADLQTEAAKTLDRNGIHKALTNNIDHFVEALFRFALSQRTGVEPIVLPTVVESYQNQLTEAKRLFQQFKEIPFKDKSPELSGHFAWRLELQAEEWISDAPELEEHLDPATLDQASLTEIMARRQVHGIEGGEGRGKQYYLTRQKEKIVSGLALPEFSYDDGELKPAVVRIRERQFSPHRRPYPNHDLAAIELPKHLLNARQSRRPSSRQQLSTNLSDSFAMDHVPEFIAAMVAGQQPSGKIYNERGRASRRRISIVIDLSVSMETRSPKLPALPIQMAIAAAQEIEKVAARSKINVNVYGLHDGGRQPVSLYSVLPSQVSQLHSLGVGGARFGAAIRRLSSLPETRGEEHLILLFTDGCPTYFLQGNDELIRRVNKKSCKACQMRAIGRRGCSVEKHTRFGSENDSIEIFEPATYQYADIANAIDSVPAGTEVRYVQFVSAPNDQLLDRFLQGKWVASSGHVDLAASFVR